MKLIIGLGNPGKEYQNNRHNVGFMVLDKIIQTIPLFPLISLNKPRWRQRVGASVFEVKVGHAQPVLLVAPQKFMNLSGQVISDLMNYYNIEPKDIIVISDDLQIDFGTIRIRKSGGDGGHNGLKSIIEHIGGDFWRIRVGIKNNHIKSPEDWHDFVLADFNKTELAKLSKILDLAATFVLEYLKQNQIEEKTLQVNAEKEDRREKIEESSS